MGYFWRIRVALGEMRHNDIQAAANAILNAANNGGKILVAGNGGSSSIASHFVNDLIKCIRIPAICLTDNIPTLTAYSNDESYDSALTNIAETILSENDVLFLLSTSGNSKNIIGLAQNFSATNKTIILSGGEGGELVKRIKSAQFIICGGTDVRSNEDAFSIVCHAIIDFMENHETNPGVVSR